MGPAESSGAGMIQKGLQNQRRMTLVFTLRFGSLIVLFLLAVLPGPFGHAAEEAKLLQKQGSQRIDQYIDHLRRTGDGASLLPELQTAKTELDASYNQFIQQQDFAGRGRELHPSGTHRTTNAALGLCIRV